MKLFRRSANMGTLLALIVSALTVLVLAGTSENSLGLFLSYSTLKGEKETAVGYAAKGEQIFQVACADCHVLKENTVSGQQALSGFLLRKKQDQIHSVSQFWESATDLFFSIKAATREHSNALVRDDEAYDLTAYILYMNGLLSEDQPVNEEWLEKNQLLDGKGFGTKWLR